MGSSWNSTEMEVISSVFGWIAFFSWSISFYPQVILNFKRKSVVGLNFDFVVLNLTKHSSYLIYNASVFFSDAVQRQYHEKYGFNEMIPVAANDVAFSIHAVVLTAFTLFQIAIYDRGGQKVSKTSISILSVAWLTVIICVTLQVVMTVIKYIPQAVMNFQRKSTVGFSIGNILLDLGGGLANYGQMAVQSIDQSMSSFYANSHSKLKSRFMGELLWEYRQDVSIFFDLLFILQHYVLYPARKTVKSLSPDLLSQEPLVCTF
ncbi:putative lysosomal cystine transporter [Helianthus annuus]|nr:putative lysosomal cystine transporter [Helianthus annuus]